MRFKSNQVGNKAKILVFLSIQTAIFASALSDVNIDFVQLNVSKFPVIECFVTVTDSFGNIVGGLDAGHFTVTEQSTLEPSPTLESPVDVRVVTGYGGIAVALVIDCSGSMSGQKIFDAKAAAKDFVANLADLDQGAIISFNYSVNTVQVFTYDKASLVSAIDGLSASGGTAFLDAIYTALEECGKISGIKAVIAFTDGQENASSHSLVDVLDFAAMVQVPVYTIGIGNDADTVLLQQIADNTGGLYKGTPQISDLLEIYNNIARLSREQYLLAYQTHNPAYDGTTRTVTVSVSALGSTDQDSRTYVVGTSARAPVVENVQVYTNGTEVPPGSSIFGGTPVRITATMYDDVGIQDARLLYRSTGTGTYKQIAMTPTTGTTYEATIPGSDVQAPGLDFYLVASDGVLVTTSPPNQPDLYPHQWAVLPNHAPEIAHTPVTVATVGVAIQITAEITDPDTSDGDYVKEAWVYYREGGHILYSAIPMVKTGANNYEASIPGGLVTEAGIDYYLVAVDSRGVRTTDGIDTAPHHVTTSGGLGGGCPAGHIRIGKLTFQADTCSFDPSSNSYTLSGNVKIGDSAGTYFFDLGPSSTLTCSMNVVLSVNWSEQITGHWGSAAYPIFPVASTFVIDPSAGTVSLEGEITFPPFSMTGNFVFDLETRLAQVSVVLKCPIFDTLAKADGTLNLETLLLDITGYINVDLECSPVIFLKTGFTLEVDLKNWVFTIGLSVKGMEVKGLNSSFYFSPLTTAGTVRFDLLNKRFEIVDDLEIKIDAVTSLMGTPASFPNQTQSDYSAEHQPQASSGIKPKGLIGVGVVVKAGTVIQLNPLLINGTVYFKKTLLSYVHLTCRSARLTLDWKEQYLLFETTQGLTLGEPGESPFVFFESGQRFFLDWERGVLSGGKHFKLLHIPGIDTEFSLEGSITVNFITISVSGSIYSNFSLLGFQFEPLAAGFTIGENGFVAQVNVQLPGVNAKAMLIINPREGVRGQFEENIAPFGVTVQTANVGFSIASNKISFDASFQLGDSLVGASFYATPSQIGGQFHGHISVFGVEVNPKAGFTLGSSGVSFLASVDLWGWLVLAEARISISTDLASIEADALKIWGLSLVGISGTLKGDFFSACGTLLGSEVCFEVTKANGVKLHLSILGWQAFSPVELHLYDAQGRHVGPNTQGGIDLEIPGARYLLLEDTVAIVVENFELGTGYTASLQGTDTGTFTLQLFFPDIETSRVVIAHYPETEVSTTTRGQIFVASGSVLTLSLDYDGDGVYERMIEPVLETVPFSKVFNDPPLIELHYPVGGEVVSENPVTIAWRAVDPDGEDAELKISLFYRQAGNITWVPIAVNITNTGTYPWDFSRLQGGKYKVRLQATDLYGAVSNVESEELLLINLRNTIFILGPNPVGDEGCVFYFALPDTINEVRISIFDISGRLVYTTVFSPSVSLYPTVGRWHPIDVAGRPLPNGVYICVLIADGRPVGQVKMLVQR